MGQGGSGKRLAKADLRKGNDLNWSSEAREEASGGKGMGAMP